MSQLPKHYDTIIIGAGISGCAAARALSRYKLKTLVIEAQDDIACGASKANSGIVHAGYDCKPGSLKAKLNVEGAAMFPALAEALDIPFRVNGSLVLCFKQEDYPKLEDFLYHAIFVPEGEELPPYEIIFQPEIYVYVKDFGNESDSGVVAEINGQVIGAAWARIIPAYGNIDDKTPELAISVLPSFRSQGIGTALMESLFKLLQLKNYSRTSLSVQQDNPAVGFYKRLECVITQEKKDHAGHEDYIMVKEL